MKFLYNVIFCLFKLNIFLGYAWAVIVLNIDIGATIFLGIVLLYCVERFEDAVIKKIL